MMKSSEEMVKSLLNRRDIYFKERRKKRQVILSVGVITLIISIGIFSTMYKSPKEVIKLGNYAIYTDDIDLSKSDGMSDMLGFLVYHEHVYTASLKFSGSTLKEGKALLGYHIGKTKEILSEYADSQQELASLYDGEVYKIKGYDEEFRLGIYGTDEDGEWIQLLDNYDGIGLNTGADLITKRLHILGNIERVTYRTHDNWNYETEAIYHEFKDLDKFNTFLEVLSQSSFIKVDSLEDIYERDVQGHIYIRLEDGTTTELRLIEGGYVTIPGLGPIMIKMNDDIFAETLKLCQ